MVLPFGYSCYKVRSAIEICFSSVIVPHRTRIKFTTTLLNSAPPMIVVFYFLFASTNCKRYLLLSGISVNINSYTCLVFINNFNIGIHNSPLKPPN